MNCLDELFLDFFDGEDIDYDDFFDEDENYKKINNSEKITLKENSNKKVSQKILPSKIYQKILNNVIDQDEAVKTVLVTIIRNNLSTDPHFKSNLMLIGGTGNGKTETIRAITKELGIPYIIEDATKYTQEGYVGESVVNSVHNLVSAAGGDVNKASRGVIVFDEIDKKLNNGDNSKVSTVSVQESLLKLIEGMEVKTRNGTINTELITFVFIGACEEVFECREKRLKGKGIVGFNNTKDINTEMKNPKFLPSDFIKAGFKSELIGRIDIIQEFRQMDIQMAEDILKKSNISPLKLYVAELKKLGVRVKMDEAEVIREIAKRAVLLKTGARGLKQIVAEMFENIYNDVVLSEENSSQPIVSCQISKDTVYDNTKYTFIKLIQGEKTKK